MKKFYLLYAFFAIGCDAYEGETLFLIRSGIESERAIFKYQGDCKLIARAMQEKEPEVTWFCRNND